MSCSFTNQVIAQLELWKEKGTGKYVNQVYIFASTQDEGRTTSMESLVPNAELSEIGLITLALLRGHLSFCSLTVLKCMKHGQALNLI
ncbi:hypothetical protein Leryth_019960 [Lithospermum erythrorhizon]|nr:hypothetical protein Leryth_019960 [Lithospermum erythrorhizon]